MDIPHPLRLLLTIQEPAGECHLSSQELAGGRAPRHLRGGAGAGQQSDRDKARSGESDPRGPRGRSSLRTWVS